MEYKRLGKTGLKVSRICLGCMSFGTPKWQPWVLDEDKSFEIIKRAYELGINFFDTADIYSNGVSEQILGNTIKKLNIPRKNVVIATKLFNFVRGPQDAFNMNPTETNVENANSRGLSRKHVFEACEASLKRLQVDYIDLYQIHRWDYDTPIEETMEALNDLVRSGKVRYIGASSMYAWQFAKANFIAEKNGWAKFVSMQDLYNLLYREEEREMIPLCLDQGVGLIPWSPLAGGQLARTEETARQEVTKGREFIFGANKPDVDKVIQGRVKELAEKKGISMAELALAWVLSKPVVTAPIIGVTKITQLEQAVSSLKVKLTDEDRKSVV